MRKLLGGACALAVFAAISLTACGGDDGGSSNDDFLAKVDAVCADTAKQVTELIATDGNPSNIEQLRAYVPKRLAISEQAQADVKAIEPPEELADEYDAYLADREDFIDLLREQGKAAREGDGATATELDDEIADAGEALAESAVAIGLDTCAGTQGAAQQDFAESADGVCIERAELIRDQFNQVPNPTTAQEYAELLPDRVPIEEQTVEKLEAIEPPSAVSDGYASYVASEGRVAEGYQRALDAANQVDTPAFQQANRRLDQLELAAARSAAAVGLGDCANHLPSGEVADLNAVIEDIWTHADPAHCAEDYTEALIEDLGGQEACEQGEVPAGEADSIEISGVHGISQVTASADVVLHGGTHDGEENHEVFEYEDGRWKLDQVVVSRQPSP